MTSRPFLKGHLGSTPRCPLHSCPQSEVPLSPLGDDDTEAQTGDWSQLKTHRPETPGLGTSSVTSPCVTSTSQKHRHRTQVTSPSAGRLAIQHLLLSPEACEEAKWLPSRIPSIGLCLFCAQPTAAGAGAANSAVCSTHVRVFLGWLYLESLAFLPSPFALPSDVAGFQRSLGSRKGQKKTTSRIGVGDVGSG